MLGVLVLVVVMAVYAGLERNVKDRILGFTPHILLRPEMPGPVTGWEEIAEKAKKLPRVQAATAFVSDNVIVDRDSYQRPVLFRGIDTSDPVQVEGIAKMLDHDHHPGSSADLGIDDRAVVSSILAKQLDLHIGDTLRLYSTRNFEQVLDAYKATEKPPVREAYAAEWRAATSALDAGWQTKDGKPALPLETYRNFYNSLLEITAEDIRTPERELVESILIALDQGEPDEAAELFRVTDEIKAAIKKGIADVNTTDAEKMDAETLKGLKSVVLPKTAEVIGVYQASPMAVTPDVFVPLPLAQDLAGLGDGVQGIALRLDDAYAAETAAAESRKILGPDWSLITWGHQYVAFFNLINDQRVMMYFALSFIVLVSAFSMMAVMFTVTIQKRREIGVMKALGAAPGQIVRVFLYQGMILGVLGSLIGVGLGRLVIHFRGPIQGLFSGLGFNPFEDTTGFSELPAYNNPVEQAVIAVIAFVLCSLAALVPAFFAARSDAAKSLRNL